MKINILLRREPFKRIFSKTIEHYLKIKYNWGGEIIWDKDPFNNNCFLVNDYLNIIFHKSIKFNKLKSIICEHYYEQNKIKYLLRIVFIKLAFLGITKKFFIKSTLVFKEHLDPINNWIFLGGNNTIKIIDLKNSECIVLNKFDFDSKFFENALKVRGSLLKSNVPKIIDYCLYEKWHKEALLNGIPLDRQRKNNKTKEVSKLAKLYMLDVYKKTSKEFIFKEYLKLLLKKISFQIENLNDNYNKRFKLEIKDFIFDINTKLNQVISDKDIILLSVTHGDFHLGNIIYNTKNLESEFQIIDWEYSSIRCIWYDEFFLKLEASNSKNISIRIKKFLLSKGFDDFDTFWRIIFNKYNLSIYTYLFILEYILSRLEESNASKWIRRNYSLILLKKELLKIELK